MKDKKNYYEISKTHNKQIQDHHFLQYNRLEARSVLIPSLQKNVYYKNKEQSSMIQSLNGDYNFKYCMSDEVPEFYEDNYNTADWDIIDVPSMWQYLGYGKCTYPNVRYPIPFNPPYVCCENPVGYYKKTFVIDNLTSKTILHFGGVDNAFYVYVNGVLAGFSKGSRIPCEFDISDMVKSGENTIAVKVFTYSDSTYLENQDMLLANGIFRDVYLIHLGEVSVWDYRVTSTESSFTVNVECDYHGEPGYEIIMSVDGQIVSFEASNVVEHTFELSNPKLWNAETPNLYDLFIELKKDGKIVEVHSKKIGIIHTGVIGNKFYVNGSPIYIKGINRHEYDCKNGRAISVDLIEKELKMIKANNINAIRCAHYTNNPAFYEIAAEIGLYVMDEADLETHGSEVTGDQGYLSKNPDWYDAYFDRISRMVKVNKNEPCIFIWSMGNEYGRGKNINKCCDYVKKFDSSREVFCSQEDWHNPTDCKFAGAGYSPIEYIKTFEDVNAPLMLLEYAHAMGNSPGFLQGYWDYIYKHENTCGGFVWEFKNHGFYSEDENGNVSYKYGGDFDGKDRYNWYNFNMDGFLTSDGTPKPTWYELGQALSPVYAEFDNGVIITNTNDFKTLEYITLKWELCEDYTVIKSGEFQLTDIQPRQTVKYSDDDIGFIPAETKPGAKYYLNLYFYDNDKEVSQKQFALPCQTQKQEYSEGKFDGEVVSDDNDVSVVMKNCKIEFKNGLISKYVVNGTELISKPMNMSFFRAATDNDGIMPEYKWFSNWFYRRQWEWEYAFIKTMKFFCEKTEIDCNDEILHISCTGKIIPDSGYLGFVTKIEYFVHGEGMVSVQITGTPFGAMPECLPRIGVMLELPQNYTQTEWYGRGKMQSYSDSVSASPIGLYNSDINELNFMFDCPQDTGNHENTRFVNISDGNGKGLTVLGSEQFSFSYHNFLLDDLYEATHINELKYSDKNYLYIDYKMRGLGSKSCGPEPEAEFELHPHSFKFGFSLSGLKTAQDALNAVRSNLGVTTERLSEDYVYVPGEKIDELVDCSED